MGVRRVVPDLSSTSLEAAKGFYGDVLGLRPVMDHGWIAGWSGERCQVRKAVAAIGPGRARAVAVPFVPGDARSPAMADVSPATAGASQVRRPAAGSLPATARLRPVRPSQPSRPRG